MSISFPQIDSCRVFVIHDLTRYATWFCFSKELKWEEDVLFRDNTTIRFEIAFIYVGIPVQKNIY